MKNKIYMLIILFLTTLLGGCDNWLEVEPENERTSSSYWRSKEEVEAVLMSCYTKLQSSLLNFIQWGELRGDGIALGTALNSEEQKIKTLDILPNNSICKWENLYTVIGRANSVIHYAPTVLEKDQTFTTELLNANIAEATVLRSLCYFYLIRTFGEVPLVLEPYVDDEKSFIQTKETESVILEHIIKDLNQVIPMCKPGYETLPDDNWQDKGRATRFAAYSLLADIYLWDGQYQKCKEACEEIINANKFDLVSAENWFTQFSKGNTEESIFELQFRGSLSQSNSLYEWFYSDNNRPRYVISERSMNLFQEYATIDSRGFGATFISRDDNRIWKYVGTGINGEGGVPRSTSQRDANWTFYRYADILFFKAEATVLLEEDNFAYAYEVVSKIRERAGYTTPISYPQDKKDALEMIMNERQREFIAEGKRWFDILRFAKQNNWEYQDYILEVLLDGIPAKDRPVWQSKLSMKESYYLPIHIDEIDANGGMLEQNPYYDEKL